MVCILSIMSSSREAAKPRRDIEEIARIVVDTAFQSGMPMLSLTFGAAIHDSESEKYARELFLRIEAKRDIKRNWLHADNGNPIRGATFAVTLANMGRFLSHSRPLVKNDNPFNIPPTSRLRAFACTKKAGRNESDINRHRLLPGGCTKRKHHEFLTRRREGAKRY